MSLVYPYHLSFFGLSGIELLVILVVGLLVIGPRDLPPVVRGIGALWRKMQILAQEFQRAFEDMADDIDAKKHADDIKNKILDETGLNHINRQTNQILNEAKITKHTPRQTTPRKKPKKRIAKKNQKK
ncbi:MAG: hypothetical protein ACR2NY_01415 [Alphaproteobacteria bacterium]